MHLDMGKMLSSIPIAEEKTSSGIVLCGYLAPSESGQIRIIVGDLCLCFAQADLLEIEPATADEFIAPPATAIAIRIVIRRRAPLLDVCLSKIYEGSFHSRKPFALAVRPQPIRKNAYETISETCLSGPLPNR